MYIEEPKKNKNGELISHIYFTEEEVALLDEEDKKLLKPCKKEIPIMRAEWQFKIPEPIKLNSLEELKESIEKRYDKKNIAIL